MNENEKKMYKGYLEGLADLHNKEVEALREEIEKFRNKNEVLKEENDILKKELKAYKKEKVELDNLYFKNLENVIEENKQLKYDKILYEVEKKIDNKIKFLQKDIKELRKCINPYPVKEEGIKRG